MWQVAQPGNRQTKGTSSFFRTAQSFSNFQESVTMLFLAAMAVIAPVDRCVVLPDEGPTVCPLQLPRITNIVVEQNAIEAWKETNPPVSCETFTLTERQVRRYFQRAWLTDRGSVHYTLPESPCQVRGRVTFSDGKSVEFQIDQYAVGKLYLSDDEPMFLYCGQCLFKPFQL
jgi:hypothetical protein